MFPRWKWKIKQWERKEITKGSSAKISDGRLLEILAKSSEPRATLLPHKRDSSVRHSRPSYSALNLHRFISCFPVYLHCGL